MTPSLDLTALRAAYQAGTLTPVELVEDLLRRIAQHADPAVWIHVLSRNELLAHARRVEARGPDAQPLYGVPFAIKDNLDLAGVPTTAACPDFGYIPSASAPVVQRLIDAGAIPVGKTNLDQFATGLVGVRSPYGVPRNPFRADLIPGGSSSGSAVAVASGLVSFALGTDTAGSGRVPAGLNHLVGLKPTRGALSSQGMVPACRSLDCISVFALTCADAAAIGAVAEFFDPGDPYSRARPGVVNAWPPAPRIGVPAKDAREFFGDTVAERLFDESLARVTALGAQLVEIDFAPFHETASLLYHGPWIAERWAALRTFHAQAPEAFFPVTRSILETGGAVSAADAFDGFHRLATLMRRAASEWEKMDALLVPTAPRPYTLAEVAADPVRANSRLGTYTNFVNLLDLSALAVPAGLRPDGIPWGVTFIAPAWRERELLTLGASWHAHVGGTLGATLTPLPATLPAPPPRPAAIRLAVVGAHLSGLPLNHQLTERGGRLVWTGRTSPHYRLHALPNTVPAKPGLVRTLGIDGTAIAVEVWELTPAAFGSFVAEVPPPLCIGSVGLENGEVVKGFLCEPAALVGAPDISGYGGWRGYLASTRGTAIR
ncbi:allophanate hydrolase [Horticoccus sp. 23ND18S-11]|uniref:allophanate hydrolase n=1 Tax=Horticoccus sp. 23ND18S-11 TaxID=3391832 RepID=UPI0039C8F472